MWKDTEATIECDKMVLQRPPCNACSSNHDIISLITWSSMKTHTQYYYIFFYSLGVHFWLSLRLLVFPWDIVWMMFSWGSSRWVIQWGLPEFAGLTRPSNPNAMWWINLFTFLALLLCELAKNYAHCSTYSAVAETEMSTRKLGKLFFCLHMVIYTKA